MDSVMGHNRWLAIVGIGEDGIDGLSPAARRLVAQAEMLVGGARHLALAGSTEAQTVTWPSPIEAAIPRILAHRGKPTCVLASGDPFFFGVGALLMRHFLANEMICLPAPSAFSLAAARLGWSLQDCVCVSLHGRALEAIYPHLQPRTRILALAWDWATAGKLARQLSARGMGASVLTVCEAMGGPNERLRAVAARDFALSDIADLNTIAVEIVAEPGAKIIPRASGLPDDWFEHGGQLTKREIRAITLAALAPRKGELLWDIGAGSGSVAIEWMLCDPANRAIAIEANGVRAARIARNALNLGTPGLSIVEGTAPQALAGLARPDAIFIGGGASAPNLLNEALAALAPGGRLVVNAVTLEGQAELTARYNRLGGDLTQIQIARADAIGRFHSWRAAMPVVQWRVEKK
jgi:precorrin-6B C5,15-methyltransferase / cobalt-precorrin-6B C5,C15-methyltransferase